MVCLYGTTLNEIPEYVRITRKLTLKESGFSDWNWLIHLLTEYTYNTNIAIMNAEGYYDQPQFPYAAHPNDYSPWGRWFARVKAALEKEFDDVNAIRVFNCCKEPPSEEIAIMIYDTCTLEEQKAFQKSLVLPDPITYEDEEEFEEFEINPADLIHSLPPAPSMFDSPASNVPKFIPSSCYCDHCTSDTLKNGAVNFTLPTNIINLNAILATTPPY